MRMRWLPYPCPHSGSPHGFWIDFVLHKEDIVTSSSIQVPESISGTSIIFTVGGNTRGYTQGHWLLDSLCVLRFCESIFLQKMEVRIHVDSHSKCGNKDALGEISYFSTYHPLFIHTEFYGCGYSKRCAYPKPELNQTVSSRRGDPNLPRSAHKLLYLGAYSNWHNCGSEIIGSRCTFSLVSTFGESTCTN